MQSASVVKVTKRILPVKFAFLNEGEMFSGSLRKLLKAFRNCNYHYKTRGIFQICIELREIRTDSCNYV